MKKNIYLVLLILLIGFGIFLILSKSGEQSGSINMAISSMPETYDPMVRSEFYTKLVADNIFEPLIRVRGQKFIPVIAQNWYNPEPGELIINIRKGVYFHNGDLLTAYDAKASLMRALYYDKSINKNVSIVDSIKVDNIHKLHVYYPKESTNVLTIISDIPMYQNNILAQFDDAYLATHPVGTGAYYLFKTSNTLITLKRFAQYWGTKSNIEQVNLQHIPDKMDQTTRLIKKEIDIVYNPPVSKLEDLGQTNYLDFKKNRSSSTMYMAFDVMREKTPYINLTPNPLRNVAVRKAIWHALNINKFIDEVLSNSAVPIALPFTPDKLGYNHSTPTREFNIEEAKKLLAEAGYPEGFTMTIDCIQDKYPGDKELGMFVKNSLEEIGIEVKLVYLRSQEFYSKLKLRDSSCYITGYVLEGNVITGALNSLFSTSEKVTGTANRFGNVIPGINPIIERIQEISEDNPEIDSLFKSATDLIYEANILIPLYVPDDVFILNKRVKWNKQDNMVFFKEMELR